MQTHVDPFNGRGYVVLRGVIEPAAVRAARREMEGLVEEQAAKLLAAGKIRDPWKDEPFATRLYRLYENCLDVAPKSFRQELHRPGLFGVFFHPKVLDVVEEFLGGEIRLYPNYTARPKFPEWEGTQVLWHQDGGYTEQVADGGEQTVEQLRMVNAWTPLVPARVANGCMQFIPGTHALGVVPHTKRRHYLEIADEVLRPRLSQAVDIELDPGDVVLFHNLLFHQGKPNRTQQIRWSLDWRYQDATQPTLRKESGHPARSRRDPERAVQNAEQWARLSFT
ncbi:MAG: phytanoyl-CoA dioxygenase family protein [Verrucomicrobiae bacterium]|nr:phytanoyl-CoA dioxygenase family protein [Verrucomicrobiae bacterium]